MNAYVHKEDYYYLLNKVDCISRDTSMMGFDLRSQISTTSEITSMMKTLVAEIKDLKKENKELREEFEAYKNLMQRLDGIKTKK